MGRVPRFFVVNLLRKHSGHNGRIGQFGRFVKFDRFDKHYTIRNKFYVIGSILRLSASKIRSLALAAGLDDIATERQLTSGWSFIVLPKAEAAQFGAQAQLLLPSGVSEFHGKALKYQDASHCQAYENFLSLLRNTAETAPACLLACSLNDQTWHSQLTSFAGRIVASVLATLGVTDSGIVSGAADAAPALFTLLRLLKTPSATVSSIDIDQNTNTGRFASRTVVVQGRSVPATGLLSQLIDAYRVQQFPQSPEIDRSGISIVDSSTSFLVQAADALGNFSMNYLIRNLAPTSPGRTKKAQIFDKVFHDLIPGTPFGQLASLTGTALELGLKQAGALTFVLERP